MPAMTAKRRILTFSGIGLAGAAIVGLATIPSAMAEERPIDPADAPGIMDRAWPEYPTDAEQHANIYAATTILGAEYNSDGIPYWPVDPTDEWNDDLEAAVAYYHLEEGLGDDTRVMGEDFWGHLDALQYDTDVATPDWGPQIGPDFYTNGDEGAGVEALQYLLYNQDYLAEDEVDGQYGPLTTAAVEDFQRDNVCEEVQGEEAAQQCDDGLTGTVTWRALVTTG